MGQNTTANVASTPRSARALRVLAAVATAGASLVGVATLRGVSSAAPTSFSESFTGTTLTDPGNWLLGVRSGTGKDKPCLTAATTAQSTNLAGAPVNSPAIAGCAASAIDTSGNGVLRLTNASGAQGGSMQYLVPQSTDNGLDISFTIAEYGGTGADGIAFYLKNGINTDNRVGGGGAALGYAHENNVTDNGIPGGLLGIGFDRNGAFSMDFTKQPGTTCAIPGIAQAPNSIGIRGGDTSVNKDGSLGYCYLGGTGSNGITLGTQSSTRAQAARKVRIVIDPNTVASPKVRVYFADSTNQLPTTPTVEVAQPDELKKASSFKFGFAAGSGSATNIHEVWDLGIKTARGVTGCGDSVQWTASTTRSATGSGTLDNGKNAVTLTMADAGTTLNAGQTFDHIWTSASLGTDGALGGGYITHDDAIGIYGTLAGNKIDVSFANEVTDPIVFVTFADAGTALDFGTSPVTLLDSNPLATITSNKVSIEGTDKVQEGFAVQVTGKFSSTNKLSFTYLSGAPNTMSFTVVLPGATCPAPATTSSTTSWCELPFLAKDATSTIEGVDVTATVQKAIAQTYSGLNWWLYQSDNIKTTSSLTFSPAVSDIEFVTAKHADTGLGTTKLDEVFVFTGKNASGTVVYSDTIINLDTTKPVRFAEPITTLTIDYLPQNGTINNGSYLAMYLPDGPGGPCVAPTTTTTTSSTSTTSSTTSTTAATTSTTVAPTTSTTKPATTTSMVPATIIVTPFTTSTAVTTTSTTIAAAAAGATTTSTTVPVRVLGVSVTAPAPANLPEAARTDAPAFTGSNALDLATKAVLLIAFAGIILVIERKTRRRGFRS